MPDELINLAADEVRAQLGIPGVNSVENNHSRERDGWLMLTPYRRFIGLIRLYDVDERPGREHVDLEPRLLAAELNEHYGSPAISTHVSASFLSMDSAGHHVDDRALVLAIASREAGPAVGITRSRSYRCTYDSGGLDNTWHVRERLPLPPAVRRRLRPAADFAEHFNERSRWIEPADVRGSDQLILYAAYVLRARRQLRAQLHTVFGSDASSAMAACSIDVRRAWTQLSFGRGGGGDLVRALQRAREVGTLESILTDAQMLEADPVKRARVTAGDAKLIARFTLGET